MSNEITKIGSRPDYLSRKIEKAESSAEGVFLYPKDQRLGSDPTFLKQIQDDIGTLDHLHAVSKMEPKFTELMDDVIHTAITLSNYCQDVTLIDGVYSDAETQKNLEKCWGYLTELSKAIQWHIHHSYQYHKFHHSIANCNSRIENFRATLAKNDYSILKSSERGENIQKELTNLIQELKQLSVEADQVTPLHKRRQMQGTKTYPAYLLTTLCLEDGTWIERGDILDVTCVNCPNNILKNEWHVKVETKSGRNRAIRLPATCLWLMDEDESPTDQDVEYILKRNKEKPCICDDKLNNKLSVLVLRKKLENLLVDCFGISNTKIRDGLEKSLVMGSMRDSLVNNYREIKSSHPNVDFELEERDKTTGITPLKDSVDFSNELDNMRIILNDYQEFENQLSQLPRNEMTYSANLKEEIAKFFNSINANDRQHESLTCISNLQKPIERNILYNTLSKKSRETSLRERQGSMSHLIDSNAYGIDMTSSIEDNRFTDACPCKYCGCQRNENIDNDTLLKSIDTDTFYQPNDTNTISNDLPVYNPEKYGTIPRYFTNNRTAENIYDQTLSSIPRDNKGKKSTLKNKRGKRFRKKSQQDESGVEFTPESEFEDYHLDTLPRHRDEVNYVNPDDVEMITETLKPNGRNPIYNKTPDTRRGRPNFPPASRTENDIKDELLNGRERSLDSITDTVVKSRIRPGRSKSTDPPLNDTRVMDPRTMDSTIKSISRDRLSVVPVDDQPRKYTTNNKPVISSGNHVSSIDDSIYPTTPDLNDNTFKKGTIRSVLDNQSNFENENEELPFFRDSLVNAPMVRRPSLKSHRVQVGYSKLNSYPLKDASVQIGQTSQMGYSEYSYDGKSHEIRNISGNYVQRNLTIEGSSFSSPVQDHEAKEMIDSSNDIQKDLNFPQKTESYGKKLQVGEPYWSSVGDIKGESSYSWPNQESPEHSNIHPRNIVVDSSQSPIKELLETKQNTAQRNITFAPVANSQADQEQIQSPDGYSSVFYKNFRYDRKTQHHEQNYASKSSFPRRRGHSAHNLCIHLHFDDCLCCSGNEYCENYDETTSAPSRHFETQRIQVCHHCDHHECCCHGGITIPISRECVTKRSRSLDYGSIRRIEGL